MSKGELVLAYLKVGLGWIDSPFGVFLFWLIGKHQKQPFYMVKEKNDDTK